jgi:hypothetical protein
MPTVRLTKKLVKAITSNAQKVVNKQLEDLPIVSAKDAKTILVAFLETHKLQASKFEYLNTNVTRMDVENVKIEGELESIYIDVPLTKMVVPRALGCDIDYVIEFDYSEMGYQFPVDHWQIISICMHKRANIQTQCLGFAEKIENLLGRCTTIKQFIEAWPQGEQFIPNMDLQKHYEQEKKVRKRGVYLDDEELQDLNSVLLTSKII